MVRFLEMFVEYRDNVVQLQQHKLRNGIYNQMEPHYGAGIYNQMEHTLQHKHFQRTIILLLPRKLFETTHVYHVILYALRPMDYYLLTKTNMLHVSTGVSQIGLK